MHRRLDGPQGQSGRFGEEKNLFPLSGFELRTVQTIDLSLHYCYCYYYYFYYYYY